MFEYTIPLVWLLSGVSCHLIAKRRLLKKSVLREMAVALTGPFALPWVLVAKPKAV